MKNLHLFQGHWVKVKGRIDTNPLRDTPLTPDTSSHQISTKNLHSFRRYRAEGNFGLKVTGSRSKVTSTRFFHAAHLCPLIHPSTTYQPIRNYRAEGKYAGGRHQTWLEKHKTSPQLTLLAMLPGMLKYQELITPLPKTPRGTQKIKKKRRNIFKKLPAPGIDPGSPVP
jgi:hypothetical protein